jgi:hypothetical protein
MVTYIRICNQCLFCFQRLESYKITLKIIKIKVPLSSRLVNFTPPMRFNFMNHTLVIYIQII